MVLKVFSSSDGHFMSLLSAISIALYINTLNGSFIWDDRAAILSNSDVHGEQPISNLLYHDFWGQNITLVDSHKSYRPLTVLTYRLNHSLHGLDTWGYHAGNIVIYIAACLLLFQWSKLWVNEQAARLCAIIFCFHPIHVEAVASLVGRADALCGAVFVLALVLYSWSFRQFETCHHSFTSTTSASAPHSDEPLSTHTTPMKSANKSPSAESVSAPSVAKSKSEEEHSWSVSEVIYFLLSLALGVAASLAKEIGVTVFGVLVVLEVAEQMRLEERSRARKAKFRYTSKGIDVISSMKLNWGPQSASPVPRLSPAPANESNLSGTHDWMLSISAIITAPVAAVHSFLHSEGVSVLWAALLAIVKSHKAKARLVSIVAVLLVFTLIRLRINGPFTLYPWTVLENHIVFLPTFKERALSYAQCHFWYVMKLVFPRYLSFDYGYACIPTIHELSDPRNLFPLVTYAAFFGALVAGLKHCLLPVLLGCTLFLFPLFPALNILFPVGTLLAERLLFIPSMGFSLLLGYLLTQDSLTAFWDDMHQFCHDLMPSLIALDSSIDGESSSVLPVISGGTNGSASSAMKGGRPKGSASKGDSRFTSPSPSGSSHARGSLSSSNSHGRYSPLKEVSTPFAGSVVGTPTVASTPTTAVARGKLEVELRSWNVYNKILRFFVLPLCILYSIRIITRNQDWLSEKQLFRSALDVCPYSVKALSNFASTTLNDPLNDNTLLAADMALELYQQHTAARINAAFAENKVNNRVTAAALMAQSIASNSKNAKAWGSLGQVYSSWANTVLDNAALSRHFKLEAMRHLEEAIKGDYAPPSILHSIGSLLLEEQYLEEALHYLGHALRINAEIRANGGVTRTIQNVDTVVDAYTYNQVGNVLLKLNRPLEAVAAFEKGLEMNSGIIALHVNLGLAVREAHGDDAARKVYQRGIAAAGHEGETPMALQNNLGLLELEAGNALVALELFTRALHVAIYDTSLPKEATSSGQALVDAAQALLTSKADRRSVETHVVGNMVSPDGQSISGVLRDNILKSFSALGL